MNERHETSQPSSGLDTLTLTTQSSTSKHPDGTTSEIEVKTNEEYLARLPRVEKRTNKSRTDILSDGKERHLWIMGENAGADIVIHNQLTHNNRSRIRFSYAPKVNGEENPFVLNIQGHSETLPTTIFYARYKESGEITNFSIEVSRSLRDSARNMRNEMLNRTPESMAEAQRKMLDYREQLSSIVESYQSNPDFFRRAIAPTQKEIPNTPEEVRKALIFKKNDPKELAENEANKLISSILTRIKGTMSDEEFNDIKSILAKDFAYHLYSQFSSKDLNSLAKGVASEDLERNEMITFSLGLNIMTMVYDNFTQQSSRFKLKFTPISGNETSQSSFNMQVISVMEEEESIEEKEIFEEDTAGFKYGLYTYSITRTTDGILLIAQSLLNESDIRTIEFPEHFDTTKVKAALTTDHHRTWVEVLDLAKSSYDQPH